MLNVIPARTQTVVQEREVSPMAMTATRTYTDSELLKDLRDLFRLTLDDVSAVSPASMRAQVLRDNPVGTKFGTNYVVEGPLHAPDG